ncbi:response regulator [Gilvimarinus sp. DA14]|uniref:response regulator n=1 Tax=Gilvimarinus sp. DA14 TaxID=2956798 RepID=UPI0020B83695|nr:response regulator [Gilvimarinus sp. DA14]UTF60956.1 response regulator [Gilvimarinus sp. DA14]
MGLSDIVSARVLLVDNFDNFRMAVMRLLQQLGCEHVDTAVNGLDALRKCRNLQYDLVLCDFSLGQGKNGLQLLEQLRKEGQLKPGAIFVLLSDEFSKALVLAAADAEPDAFLTKPVSTKTLRDRLARLLQQRRAMAPYWSALNAGDRAKAIEICQVLSQAQGRYQNQVQKLLGQLLLEEKRYDSAEAFYRQVMTEREWDWAQLGIARVYAAQNDWQRAEHWLEQALVSNENCLPALDLLAEMQAATGDPQARQAVLQQAVELSPLSVVRQQLLGQQALDNRQLLLAANALRQAVRLGLHSCYDNPDVHLAFVRSCAELGYTDREKGQSFYKDAKRVLEEFDSRFTQEPEQQLELRSVACAFNAIGGDAVYSRQLMQQMQAEHELISLPVTILLDLASAADYLQELALRDELLEQLRQHHCQDQAVLEKVDVLLAEPLSRKKRERLASLNKQGIGLYESKNYPQALVCFEQAMCEFPRHSGVALNLLQTIVAALGVAEEKEPHRRRGQVLIERLQQGGELDIDQRDRFNRLRQQWAGMN